MFSSEELTESSERPNRQVLSIQARRKIFRQVMKGRRLSREQADKQAQCAKNHLLSYFGPKKLTDIDDSMIETWQPHLKNKGAISVETRKTGMGSETGNKGLSG